MKINLIMPGQLDERGEHVPLKKEISLGLTLPYLAALIPAGHQVRIIDDSVEKIDFAQPVDLVGITSYTSRAPRAYWIADQYRARGVPVLMGGFHVSTFPEEALEHCDAVVRGEAEGLMERIIDDAAQGKMQGIYQREEFHELKGLPFPRYDLARLSNYILPWYPVQITRGCPHGCEFCSVTNFYGRRYRMRPIGEVIEEFKRLGPFLFITDDNLTLNRGYVLELFRAMRPLGKFWAGQANISVATDEELLQAAAQSGCGALYLGVESLDPDALCAVNKKINLSIPITEALHRLRRYNIEPFLSMIIGFDNDGEHTPAQIIEFCEQYKIPILFLYILTPVPGTKFFQQLENEGRILHKDWHLYDGMHAVFRHPRISPAQLEEMYWEIMRRFYSPRSISRRVLFPPHFMIMVFNWVTRKKVQRGMHPWMGFQDARYVRMMDATLSFFLRHPLSRKVSTVIRYSQGRLIS